MRRGGPPSRAFTGMSQTEWDAIPLGTPIENWEFPGATLIKVANHIGPRLQWVAGAPDVFDTYGHVWSPAVSWCRVAQYPTRVQLPQGNRYTLIRHGIHYGGFQPSMLVRDTLLVGKSVKCDWYAWVKFLELAHPELLRLPSGA